MNDEDTMDWRRRWMYICWDQKHFAPNPPESPFLSAPLDTVENLHHLCILQLEYVEKKITFGMEIEVTGLPFMDILLPKKFAMLESTFIDSTPIWLQKISPTTAKNYKTESSVFGPKIPDFFCRFWGTPQLPITDKLRQTAICCDFLSRRVFKYFCNNFVYVFWDFFVLYAILHLFYNFVFLLRAILYLCH